MSRKKELGLSLLWIAILLGAMCFGVAYLQKQSALQLAERQQEQALRVQLVAAELEMDEKHILDEGKNWNGDYQFRTNEGVYFVEFNDESIQTIVKK